MDFERICTMFTMQEPFYGILLSSMQRVPDDRIGTLAVGQVGNVFKLVYSPKFIEQFNVDTVLSLLRHEVLHLAFNHLTIFEDKEKTPQTKDLENIACDAEVNCYLDRSKVQKEAGGIWVEDYGFDKNLGAREYYRLFLDYLKNKQQEQQAQDPNQPCNGGQRGNGQQDQNSAKSQSGNQQNPQAGGDDELENPGEDPGMNEAINSVKEQMMDGHDDWPRIENDIDAAELQDAVETLLVFAAEETEKSCGTIPGEIAGRIEKLRKRKPKPVADWRRYFRRYIGNEFTELTKKSRKRESRRFPDAAGNRHQRKSHILVAIDTSGSVSMPEYLEFFGQIRTLQDKASFHVIECDAKIQHEYDFRGQPNQTLHGGGGTSFEPPIQEFMKNRKKYDALVYFTDGGAWIPDYTPKDTLWVISSRGDHDRKRYKVNGASVVIIPKKEQNESC